MPTIANITEKEALQIRTPLDSNAYCLKPILMEGKDDIIEINWIICGGTLWLPVSEFCRLAGISIRYSSPICTHSTNDDLETLSRVRIGLVGSNFFYTCIHYSELQFITCKKDVSRTKMHCIQIAATITEYFNELGTPLDKNPNLGTRHSLTNKKTKKTANPPVNNSNIYTETIGKCVAEIETTANNIKVLHDRIEQLESTIKNLPKQGDSGGAHISIELLKQLDDMGLTLQIIPKRKKHEKQKKQ